MNEQSFFGCSYYQSISRTNTGCRIEREEKKIKNNKNKKQKEK